MGGTQKGRVVEKKKQYLIYVPESLWQKLETIYEDSKMKKMNSMLVGILQQWVDGDGAKNLTPGTSLSLPIPTSNQTPKGATDDAA